MGEDEIRFIYIQIVTICKLHDFTLITAFIFTIIDTVLDRSLRDARHGVYVTKSTRRFCSLSYRETEGDA